MNISQSKKYNLSGLHKGKMMIMTINRLHKRKYHNGCIYWVTKHIKKVKSKKQQQQQQQQNQEKKNTRSTQCMNTQFSITMTQKQNIAVTRSMLMKLLFI
jgi:hypothetical protein